MENQLSPGQIAELKAQLEVINSYGIKPEQFMSVIDGIINGDLSAKNYKKSKEPLVKIADKQKEIKRIINNYGIALKSLNEDRKNGKDDETKSIIKISVIVGAAKAGLTALGLEHEGINIALGLAE